jgi:hypothetical protein
MESTAKTAGDFANTSSGLANQQRILTARFTDLQAEIGTALLPAVTELVGQFADRLIPVFEEFGDFLASPQGKKIIEDTAKAIGDLFEFIADNINTIVDFALKIAAAITALKLLKTALEFATIAQSAFNLIVKANPYILAATAIISLIGALKVYTDWLVASGIVKEKDTKSAEALTEEIRRLEEAHEDGLIPTDKFTVKLEQLEGELRAVQGAAMDVDLSALRTQFGDTRVDALRLVSAQRQLYYAMKGVTPPPLPGQDDDTGGGGGGGGGGGQSDREKAFERVQKIIKDAQKKIRDANERYTKAIQAARKTYDKTIADATATYSEAVTQAEIQRDKSLAEALKAHNQNIATIQRDFANRQADIIQQSIDRLRDAYASAVRTNVADLFGTDAVGKSIDKLIANLRDRLTASRTLVSNAASLASSGFSQTFIEQIVGAGLETGNELAKAILTATPETQRELQSLFGALETESESGMDTLAKTIFDKTGLATTELKRLFEQTKTDLAESLKQAQIDYTASQDAILISFNEALAQAQKARDEAFGNATTALNEALSTARDQYLETLEDIREAFNEQIAAMEGQLGGLGNTVKQLLAMMAQLASGGAPKISTLPSFPTGGTTPVIQTLPLTPQKPTVVNNNTFIVKQDVTQSPSMTGAAISKAINKYVGGGGGLNRGIAAV